MQARLVLVSIALSLVSCTSNKPLRVHSQDENTGPKDAEGSMRSMQMPMPADAESLTHDLSARGIAGPVVVVSWCIAGLSDSLSADRAFDTWTQVREKAPPGWSVILLAPTLVDALLVKRGMSPVRDHADDEALAGSRNVSLLL